MSGDGLTMCRLPSGVAENLSRALAEADASVQLLAQLTEGEVEVTPEEFERHVGIVAGTGAALVVVAEALAGVRPGALAEAVLEVCTEPEPEPEEVSHE